MHAQDESLAGKGIMTAGREALEEPPAPPIFKECRPGVPSTNPQLTHTPPRQNKRLQYVTHLWSGVLG